MGTATKLFLNLVQKELNRQGYLVVLKSLYLEGDKIGPSCAEFTVVE